MKAPVASTTPTFLSARARSARTRRIRIALPLMLLALIMSVSTCGYVLIEWPAYSFLDAVYMTVITISTVGTMEVHPLSSAGRVWTIFVIVCGVITAGIVVGQLASMLVEGQIRRIMGRRQLENKIKNLHGHVIVCGYGRMGQRIADELAGARRETVIVDIDPDQTAVAEAADVLYVLGDAQDESVLAAAGIERAKELVAALPTDAENVLVTLTAHQMKPAMRIIARAINPAIQDKLTKAGATRVVCPPEIGASRMVDIIVRPAVVDFAEVAKKGVDLEMDQLVLSPESEMVGKSLRELELTARAGVYVVAIRRTGSQTIYQPPAGLKLEAGDTLLLIGKSGSSAALQKLCRQGEAH